MTDYLDFFLALVAGFLVAAQGSFQPAGLFQPFAGVVKKPFMHVVITVCEELHLVAVCRAPYTRLLVLVTNARPRAIARGSKAVHLAGNGTLRL